MLPQDHTEAQRIALVQQLGLDQPFFVQYCRFLLIALHGDFGNSLPLGTAGRPPDRRAAAGDAGTGDHRVGAGVRDRRADGRLYRYPPHQLPVAPVHDRQLVGVSLPTFLLGILLILVFSVWLGWLPSFGRGPTAHVGQLVDDRASPPGPASGR